MAEPKTKATTGSVSKYLDAIQDAEKRANAKALLKMYSAITKEKPVLWSNSMISFGTYHYKSERSSQEGDWPLSAFSVRKQNLTVYTMSGTGTQKELLKKLGKHKVSGGSCLYINHLSDIDLSVLKKVVANSHAAMKKRYKK